DALQHGLPSAQVVRRRFGQAGNDGDGGGVDLHASCLQELMQRMGCGPHGIQSMGLEGEERGPDPRHGRALDQAEKADPQLVHRAAFRLLRAARKNRLLRGHGDRPPFVPSLVHGQAAYSKKAKFYIENKDAFSAADERQRTRPSRMLTKAVTSWPSEMRPRS